jgi:hypothetical protein
MTKRTKTPRKRTMIWILACIPRSDFDF